MDSGVIEMSDKTKELILKTLLVIGMVLLFMLFPGCIFLSMLIPSPEAVNTVLNIIIFAFFGVGILFMVLLPIFGRLRQKPVKAEKASLAFATYNEFMDFTHKLSLLYHNSLDGEKLYVPISRGSNTISFCELYITSLCPSGETYFLFGPCFAVY